MQRGFLALAIVLALPSAAATPGFVEDFTAGVAGFSSFSSVTHVASGGVGGVGDGYIEVSNLVATNLGAFSTSTDLTGNLPRSGTGYSFWLRDTSNDDDHEIHVGIGVGFANFWLNTQAFNPPDGQWQQFSVDLTDPSQWVQIIALVPGTFEDALATSTHLLFRHDTAPFVQLPDLATGEFALDRIEVLHDKVPAASAGGRLALGVLLGAIAAFGLRRQGGRAATYAAATKSGPRG